MIFEAGTTVRFKVAVKGFTGGDEDADEPPRITLWDASGVKRVDSASTTKDAAGKYHIDLTLDEGWVRGTWIYECRASIAGKPLVARGSLRVVKTE